MLIFGKFALGVAGAALIGTGVLCSEGLIRVEVVQKAPESHHIYVVAPALLVPMGVHFAPRENLAEASREIRPWLPTIRAALDALRDSDDITLVEVRQPGEEVHIAKIGGSIVVDVHDTDNEVHVSTPIRAISSSIEELAAAAPSAQP
jgi:hypothetical protein